IRFTVAENLDEYQPHECAFLVYCDTRFTPLAITRELAKSPVCILRNFNPEINFRIIFGIQ
ncbi:unnamed protein product, partial [Onchocerca ochengi]|uniref:AAA_8 domain-containing protein n=1 Tax=Onchocerca ochengi TaxID=42157 RepID=A0A182EY74_ONCOC